MNYRNVIAGMLGIVTAFCFASRVFAHGAVPRLEINMERLNPGGVVEVRGVDFEFEELISLSLIGQEVEIPLGEITVDTEGVFNQIITLPVDLSEGSYNFRVTTDDHEVISPPLVVWGSPILSAEEGEGAREEEDGLLAPMPTILVSEAMPAPPQSSGQLTAVSSENSRLVIVLTTLGILGILAFITRKAMIRAKIS